MTYDFSLILWHDGGVALLVSHSHHVAASSRQGGWEPGRTEPLFPGGTFTPDFTAWKSQYHHLGEGKKTLANLLSLESFPWEVRCCWSKKTKQPALTQGTASRPTSWGEQWRYYNANKGNRNCLHHHRSQTHTQTAKVHGMWKLHLLQIFSLIPYFLKISFMVCFAMQKLSGLIVSHLLIFGFILIKLGRGSKKILLWFMSKRVFCMFSSKSL